MHRRDMLRLGTVAGLSAALAAAGARPARADDWPGNNVRVLVPYAAGSATDLIPRTIFDVLGAKAGHTFIVENRLGGGTTVAANAAARAQPDGYTMLVHSNAVATVPAIQTNVPYDPVKDFSAITPLGNVPLVLVVAPDKKIASVQALVALAKAKPNSINYAAAGIGTPPHLTAERFRLAAGFDAQLVPFKGSPEALTEMLTGRVDFYFVPLPAAPAQGAGGRRLAPRPRAARRADHRGGRLSQLGFRLLGRRLRAQADAARPRRHDPPQGRGGDRKRRRAGAPLQARRRADDHDAGGLRRPCRQGSRHREAARQGGEHRGAVTRAHPRLLPSS
jgi:tripartite-type tricarboxylate transporter receptor subunit TctC